MSQYQILTCRSNPIRILYGAYTVSIRCFVTHRMSIKPYISLLSGHPIRIIRIFPDTLRFLNKFVKKIINLTHKRARKIKITPYNPYNPYKTCLKPL
jgi:hypothetical protein